MKTIRLFKGDFISHKEWEDVLFSLGIPEYRWKDTQAVLIKVSGYEIC